MDYKRIKGVTNLPTGQAGSKQLTPRCKRGVGTKNAKQDNINYEITILQESSV